MSFRAAGADPSPRCRSEPECSRRARSRHTSAALHRVSSRDHEPGKPRAEARLGAAPVPPRAYGGTRDRPGQERAAYLDAPWGPPPPLPGCRPSASREAAAAASQRWSTAFAGIYAGPGGGGRPGRATALLLWRVRAHGRRDGESRHPAGSVETSRCVQRRPGSVRNAQPGRITYAHLIHRYARQGLRLQRSIHHPRRRARRRDDAPGAEDPHSRWR